MSAKELISNPKVATGVIAVAASSGISTYLELLPPILGVISSALGAIGAAIVVIGNYRRIKAQREIYRLRLKILKKQQHENIL